MNVKALLFSAFALLATACATASAPPVETTAAPSCDDLAGAARKEVSSAIESHAACTQDSDCVETALAASCFDSCSRVVASSGAFDVKAARAKVDDAQCKEFAARGCKMIVPPCAPPRPPRCNAGACTT
ncbi:MAG TPA: hypothetical protein VIF62_27130 [Labilithrix sp.]|jgi:hypothetical protein